MASVAGEVEQLSFDHKPSNEAESRRITAAGGWVEFNRVNGRHYLLVWQHISEICMWMAGIGKKTVKIVIFL